MRSSFVILSIAFFIVSCQKENIDEETTIIKYGTVCMMGSDSLTIEGNDLWYAYVSYFDDKRVNKHEIMSEAEKESLFDALDYNEFANIHLNSCFVCVDGCDDWISIKDNNKAHKISYAYYDTLGISTIEEFIDQLDLLKSKFYEE
jgi:hypothetical protein